MASAASPQSLADVFECPVCLDSFKDPRVLPACGHIFCSECIEKMHEDGTVSCPTCRKVSGEVEEITQISDLAKAFIVNELQQRFFKEKRKNSITRFCACCSKKAEPAKYYCNECRLCLCDSCEAQHQEGSLFEGHGTEPLDRITFCKVHESQQVNFYCRPCNEFICSGCAIGKHNGHAVVNINIEAANCRQAGADMNSNQKKQFQANKEKISEARQFFEDQERDMEDAEKHIRSIEEMTVSFIKQLQTLSEMIKSAQNANQVAIDEFVSKIWQKNIAIWRDKRKVSELLSEEMTDCQVIDNFQELRELDTDYNKEEENIPVYNQIQAVGEDVRSRLSTLINSVQQNFPGYPNAEPSLLSTASSSKRQAEQSSTPRNKRTKTAHRENNEKPCSSHESSTHNPSSPETTPMSLAHTSSVPGHRLSGMESTIVTTKQGSTAQGPLRAPKLLLHKTQGPQQPTTRPQTKVQRPLGTPKFGKCTTPSPKLSTTFPQTKVQMPQEPPKHLPRAPGPQQSTTRPQPTDQRPKGTPKHLPTAPGPQQSTTRPQPTVQKPQGTPKHLPRAPCPQQSTTRPQPTDQRPKGTPKHLPTAPGPQQSTTRPQPTVQKPQGTPKHLPTAPGPKLSTTRPQPTVQRPQGTPKHLPTAPGPKLSTTRPQPTVQWPLGPPIYQLPAPGSQQSTTPPQTKVQTPEETREFLQHLTSCPQQ